MCSRWLEYDSIAVLALVSGITTIMLLAFSL
jgi:hypothetical protein